MIRKGTYVLAISLGSDQDIKVGALGILHFEKGVYCYVGSALGGLDSRIARHMRKDKVLKWHADYITTVADSVDAYISYPDYIEECNLAKMAMDAGMEPSHKGFGCSDCKCYTHLFKADDRLLRTLIKKAKMTPFRRLTF
ncbi:MAG: GIY-YIG nuclease family protein [Candidatus Methanomethylophilaceae archaeon]|jgi:Uri superfamily endonuclease|nr:GIY-YIG nuclease family protein [Candidatus Methanomethylophilaceae archaeon]